MMRSAKYGRTVQILCLVLLSGLLFWLSTFQQVGDPVFSHESGFYEEDFLLEISAANAAKIYYTLDGSQPDETALEYTGPLHITNATKNENTHSMRTDVSAGFYADLIAEHKPKDGKPKYQTPDYLLDKCTVLRAVAVSRDGTVSNEISATYFVELRAEDYDGCNIISVITDPANLYDSENGIYVTGNRFMEYMRSGEIADSWHEWDANYRQQGMAWERPAIFDFFGSDGRLISSMAGGIRTHGDYSRGSLPRSLNLYARREYSRTEDFGFKPFATDFIPQRVVLHAGGNATLTQFPDYMVTRMVREMKYTTLLQEPYVLFLNGEYWGFYWLTEKLDEEYMSHYYNVEQNNVIIIKDFMVANGIEQDLWDYYDMRDYISDNDMTDAELYDQVCRMIDVESCIDYYATMIYIARNNDWPLSNEGCWRVRNPSPGNPYADGRWRWMLYDLNSPGLVSTEHDTLNYVLEKDDMFASLWENPAFREALVERLFYVGQNCFAAEKVDAFIDDYMESMMPKLEKSWARYYGQENSRKESFVNKMEDHRSFFRGRMAVVESWFS